MLIRHFNVEKTSYLEVKEIRKQRRKFSNLLHFSVNSESLASQVLLQKSKLLEATWSHTADRTCGSKAVVHPHYSPELIPSDFHLLGTHKYNLLQMSTWITDLLHAGIHDLVPQMLISREVWCVPSATRWSRAHQSQNKFLSCRVFVVFLETPLCIWLRFQLTLKLKFFLSINNPNINNCVEHHFSIQQLKHVFLLKSATNFIAP